VAWTDLHIAPTAQRDCTQVVLVCAHALACTEGVGGRAERRVGPPVAAVAPARKHRTAGALFPESASGLRSPDLFDTLVHSEYGPLMINKMPQ